jgi:hypothetical protein
MTNPIGKYFIAHHLLDGDHRRKPRASQFDFHYAIAQDVVFIHNRSEFSRLGFEKLASGRKVSN